jgi:hypothetical protein
MVEIFRELEFTQLVNDGDGNDIIMLVDLLHDRSHDVDALSFLYHVFGNLSEVSLLSTRGGRSLRDDRCVAVIGSIGDGGECTCHK